jgi:hypothetical protein
VCAHQCQPPGPIEVDRQGVADARRVFVARLELVDDLAAGLPRGADGPRPSVLGPQQQAAIGRLAAATGVEDRSVQDDQRRLAGVDGRDACLDGPGVGVRVAELLTGRGYGGLDVTGR